MSVLDRLTIRDIKPKDSVFHLSFLGEVEIKLRAFSIMDWEWVKETYGDAKDLETALNNSFQLCRVAFHQMDNESKALFPPADVEFINEDGESFSQRLGGYKLLAARMSQLTDIEKMTTAIIHCIGVGQPILDALEKEQLKKKEVSPDKAKSSKRQTGPKSATSSELNTDSEPMRSLA